jgi:hypothetical protein
MERAARDDLMSRSMPPAAMRERAHACETDRRQVTAHASKRAIQANAFTQTDGSNGKKEGGARATATRLRLYAPR